MWLFFCLFSCHEKLQSFFLLQSIRVSIFYGLELVFKVSFWVRNKINKVMSVWQLTTNVAAILVLPIRHSGGFTFVAAWAIHLYIDQWSGPQNSPVMHCQRRCSQASSATSEWRILFSNPTYSLVNIFEHIVEPPWYLKGEWEVENKFAKNSLGWKNFWNYKDWMTFTALPSSISVLSHFVLDEVSRIWYGNNNAAYCNTRHYAMTYW